MLNAGNESNLILENTGAEELRHLFVLEVRSGLGRFVYQEYVPSGQHAAVELTPDQEFRPLADLATRISDQMSRVLVTEGLYEPEARAMVNTWRQSWFEEEGLRVLYLLPRRWTDEVLPLTLDPRPRDVVRTMVGRAEVITPGTEWELLRQIVRFADGAPADQRQAVENVRRLGLGRFIQPAVRRIGILTPVDQATYPVLVEALRRLGYEDGLARARGQAISAPRQRLYAEALVDAPATPNGFTA